MSLIWNKRRHASMIAAAVAAAISTSALQAAEESTLEEIIVTGTRAIGVALSESATPVQLVTSEVLESAGKPDLMGVLAQIVPSFTAQAFGGDMANQTLQAKLRGLSPNHVLILVDGKRRHTTANLSVLGGPFQGGAGVDLNFIPLDMIDHVEVLTDGAAAQYGTDAIAGVVNIITKKNTSGGSVAVTGGAYYDEGGQSVGTSGNIGFEPAPGAYINLTAEARKKGDSTRASVAWDIYNPSLATISKQNAPYMDGYPILNHIHGDVKYATQLVALSAGYAIGEDMDLYFQGTWGHKTAGSFENVRLPHRISGTFNGDTIYAFPYGFNPREESDERDWSTTFGLSGESAGWRWDVGTVYGTDEMDVFTRDSVNQSLWRLQLANAQAAGLDAPPMNFRRDFYDGTLSTTQWTTSIDVSKDLDFAMPVTLAFGAEYREDSYEIGAGEAASYYGVGAASFPGYGVDSAGKHTRDNKGIYANVVVKPLAGWTVDVAGRWEDYSDFGSETIGKFTTRYDFTDSFALRGTYSTGFRAPTLAEEFYSATNVGPTSTSGQIPPNSPTALAIMGHGLEAEKSDSFSAGLVFEPGPSGALVTLDVFQIKLKNRIAGSSTLTGLYHTVIENQAIVDIVDGFTTIDPNAFSDPNGTVSLSLFINGIDTRTRGVDLVASYKSIFNVGSINWSLGATKVKTVVTKKAGVPAIFATARNTSLFDISSEGDLEDAQPEFVVNIGALAELGPFTINLREVIYGNSQQVNRYGTPSVDYVTKLGTAAITNLDVSWSATGSLTFTLGAQNLFNQYPVKYNKDLTAAYKANFDGSTTLTYPTISPYGFNGGYYYGKVAFKF
jgi:iron complex outermembrane recepter protein